MYISCFVGPRCASSLSSHQTFILHRRIYISRDPAQPNLLGRVPFPLCPVITLSVCFMSYSVFSTPLPQPFCSNPLLLKASLSFLSCSLFIPSPIARNKGGQAKNSTNVLLSPWIGRSLAEPCLRSKQYMRRQMRTNECGDSTAVLRNDCVTVSRGGGGEKGFKYCFTPLTIHMMMTVV